MTPEDNLQPPTNNEQVDPGIPLKQIRTYQGDVANALHTQNESLVSIERAEHARRPLNDDGNIEKTSWKKSLLLILGSFVLIVGGATGGWYSYKEYKLKTAVPEVKIAPNRFITSREIDTNISDLDRAGVIQKLSDVSLDVEDGEIAQLELLTGQEPNQKPVETVNFLSTLGSSAPGSLVRALDPLFMYGYIGSEPRSAFIIFKLTSFEYGYSGMLEWEASLKRDLGPLFATRQEQINVSDDTQFVDVSIKNKDARALKDSDGKTLILYSFFDNNWIIITDSEDSLIKIIDRLNSEKLSR